MRKFRAPIERCHLIIALVIAIGTPVLTVAVTYGRDANRLQTVETTIADHDKRIDRLEDSANRTDRNVVRIGTKFGLDMEKPK